MDSYDILISQKKKLEPFFHNLNTEKINKIGDILANLDSKTNLFIYGIGKSENIAKHFATILNSISIKSFANSTQNCLHGDIGMIHPDDWIFLISNSGNTQELLDIVPHIKNKTDNLIGIFTNPQAKLLKYCKEDLILPKVFEIDKFNHIPTTSIVEYILFINILTAYIIEKRNMDINEYASNHPCGNIGNQIYKRVKDVMIPLHKIALIEDDITIKDCLFKICEKHLRCAVVLTPEKFLVGIATDGNIRRYLSNDECNLTDSITNCLNIEPFTVYEYDKMSDIIDDIKKDSRLLSGIPVINEKRELVGLLSQHQIIDYGL